jgi:hypothetical protein
MIKKQQGLELARSFFGSRRAPMTRRGQPLIPYTRPRMQLRIRDWKIRGEGEECMVWPRLLAYITGTVDQELLVRNEYLAAENRILKAQIRGRLCLSNADRATLVEIGHRLGRKALGEVANAALPDTILGWYRRLVARKFDGCKSRRRPGRPRVDWRVEQLIVNMAKENSCWAMIVSSGR